MRRETECKWNRERKTEGVRQEKEKGGSRRKQKAGEGGGEVSGDSKAEKLHFDGGKLNQVSSEDLGAERQIETVMSARRDYYRLCVCAT